MSYQESMLLKVKLLHGKSSVRAIINLDKFSHAYEMRREFLIDYGINAETIKSLTDVSRTVVYFQPESDKSPIVVDCDIDDFFKCCKEFKNIIRPTT